MPHTEEVLQHSGLGDGMCKEVTRRFFMASPSTHSKKLVVGSRDAHFKRPCRWVKPATALALRARSVGAHKGTGVSTGPPVPSFWIPVPAIELVGTSQGAHRRQQCRRWVPNLHHTTVQRDSRMASSNNAGKTFENSYPDRSLGLVLFLRVRLSLDDSNPTPHTHTPTQGNNYTMAIVQQQQQTPILGLLHDFPVESALWSTRTLRRDVSGPKRGYVDVMLFGISGARSSIRKALQIARAELLGLPLPVPVKPQHRPTIGHAEASALIPWFLNLYVSSLRRFLALAPKYMYMYTYIYLYLQHEEVDQDRSDENNAKGEADRGLGGDVVGVLLLDVLHGTPATSGGDGGGDGASKRLHEEGVSNGGTSRHVVGDTLTQMHAMAQKKSTRSIDAAR